MDRPLSNFTGHHKKDRIERLKQNAGGLINRNMASLTYQRVYTSKLDNSFRRKAQFDDEAEDEASDDNNCILHFMDIPSKKYN